INKAVHGDPGERERVINMFWGLAQLYNVGHEFYAFTKDGNPKHLVSILTTAAFSTHTALTYQPRRATQWLPESLPGMTKSPTVRQAEALQAKIQARTEKAQATYEARHGIQAALDYQTEQGQLRALQRSAGVHPAPPGPPKPTRILPSQRSNRSGKPKG